MILKNMSAEELISYRDDCREFLDDPERSLHNIKAYHEASAEILSRLECLENLKCCGNCKLFCSGECPHKERIDNDQVEYYPADYVCDCWTFDGKKAWQRLIR